MSSKQNSLRYSYRYSFYCEGKNPINKVASGSEVSQHKRNKIIFLMSLMVFLGFFILSLIITKNISVTLKLIMDVGSIASLITVIYFIIEKIT